jgi:uncharacterized protein YhaN
MKIKKLNFVSFGKLLQKSIALNDGVNIIYGKNESGKSTLTEGIITLFYGIYPIAKDKNPYVNWDHHELNIKGLIEHKAENYEVSRELMSQPMGTIKRNNNITQISNSTLNFMKRMPIELYRDLYCLETRKIDEFKKDTWAKVDSQMIFSYDKTGINKPEDVLKRIDEELNQIWRESNRGNYRLKTIEEDMNELKRKKSELIKIYKHTKNDIEQIDELKTLIKKLRKQLNDLEAKRRKIKKLMPIANIYIEKASLKKAYENYTDYRLLSKDILDDRRLLVEQVKSIQEEICSIEETIEKKVLEKNNFSKVEELIVKNKEVINQKINDLKEIINRKKALDALETKEQLILDAYNELFYKIFNKMCTKEDFNKIKNTSVKAINLSSISKKIVILFILSIVAGSLFYYFNQLFISVLFFSTSIASLMTLLLNKNNKNELKGLTFSSVSKDSFLRLKEKEFQLLALLKEKNQLNQSIAKESNEVKLFFKPYIKSDDLQEILNYFDHVFQVIQKKQDENNSLAMVLKEFEISLNKKINILEEHESKLDIINNFLRELSQSSIEKGIEIFKNNHKIEEQIEHLDKKIDGIENGRLLLEGYKISEEIISSEKLNLIEIQIDELNSEMSNHQVTLAKLEEKVQNVSITEAIQSIATEIDLLGEEKEKLIKRKHQLLAMKEIIQKSNEAFKDDYQPNIIKDANEYFNAFTESKYDKILINPETKEIYLDLGKYNKEIKSGFSRGTMDQLFLALRLGVIKHYEKDTKFPLLLDEFFSNWDQERLVAFVKVLKLIQKERQVIITTCKKNIVDTFSRLMNTQMIQIEGDN